MTASMTVGDWITIQLVETFVPCFLDDIGTSWILKPHGFKTEERSGSWLSRSGGLYSDVCVICCGKVGGSVSGWAVVCFGISGSVSDVGGAGIGTVGVIGVVGFVAAAIPSMTVKSLNSLLNGLCDCGEFRKLREMFLGFHKYGTPDACTYNILIKARCRSGRLEDAWLEEAFKLKNDMMRVYGVMPNAFVYTSLIKGVCGIGELSLAFKLKEEMVRNKLKLNSTVYSTLISVLFEVGRKEEVLGLLEEMKGFGCMPDTVTYNAMISGFCKERNSEAAFRILDEMVEKGFVRGDCKHICFLFS
ncbi:putative pentatricopeptide repeat-containing protein At1g53330 [Quercus lobata]|uniref:putative pentatricopeptide repeat-containing protein At1g53330 n=1 Tax=Quercus lobata TaxID=97700 RepID=UPI001244F320|nr:putative pentatricopeptide repeat-containing protein At1g53330 [Quercus lobata]